MELKTIYDKMKRAGLFKKQDEFSSDWLGMHWNYYSIMRERTSLDPLMRLWKRLLALGEMDLAHDVFTLVVERVGPGDPVNRDAEREMRVAAHKVTAATTPDEPAVNPEANDRRKKYATILRRWHQDHTS